MAYDLTSNVEFTYNYTGSFSSLAYDSVLSAFSTTGNSIVGVTIASASYVVTTINAGYFSHVTDRLSTVTLGSTYDLGYTSSPSSSSTYTTGTNALATGSAGPTDSKAGYGTLELGGGVLTANVGSSVNFEGAGNTLIFDTTSLANLSLLSSINGFNGNGDQIVFNGVAASKAAIVGYSNGVLTFSNAGTVSTIAFGNMGSSVTAGNFSIGSAAALEGGNSSTYSGNLVITFATCFLRGTMIATPQGEVAVETLRRGDLVTAIENGLPVSRPVTWLGGRAMRAADHDGCDAAYPVRIRRGAFAENVPHRDLLVTPEHCIHTEAGLTPVRMLVNGASILIDRSIPDYEFFHVELTRHSILLSEGLATESYLDSGNRALFIDAAAAPALHADVVMAAPLAVARAVVEPIWHRLADRARALGFETDGSIVALTDQPDLRLLLEDGRELTACWHDAQRHMFQLPRGSRAVRLLSRAAVPSEMVGPFVDDRRTLGVAVDRLVLWTGLDEQVLRIDSPALRGWHRGEGAPWTDGSAELDLPRAESDTVLDIHLAATMIYRDETALAA